MYLGQQGLDTMSYAAYAEPVFVNLGDTTLPDGGAGEGDSVSGTFENLTGGGGDDVLVGGTGANRIAGGDGDDVVGGAAGDDDLAGDAGDDLLRGGDGDDTLRPGPGVDTFAGGSGTDTVAYSLGPVAVTLGAGTRDDGAAGERDDVQGDVENVRGTFAADRLTGAAAGNLLDGGRGDDVLDGAGGPDRLLGGFGDDTLVGGSGVDGLDAGPGADLLDARDGVRDAITCGDGLDAVALDLVDPAPADCEAVARFAVDDGPPARGRSVQVAGRRLRVRVACPSAARVDCRGVLTVRDSRGRTLVAGRYSVRRGRAAVSAFVLRRRSDVLVVGLRERGVSAKGPRASRTTFRPA